MYSYRIQVVGLEIGGASPAPATSSMYCVDRRTLVGGLDAALLVLVARLGKLRLDLLARLPRPHDLQHQPGSPAAVPPSARHRACRSMPSPFPSASDGSGVAALGCGGCPFDSMSLASLPVSTWAKRPACSACGRVYASMRPHGHAAQTPQSSSKRCRLMPAVLGRHPRSSCFHLALGSSPAPTPPGRRSQQQTRHARRRRPGRSLCAA